MQSEKPFYLSTTFWGIALSALGMAAQRLVLAQLAASDAPLERALDAAQARTLNLSPVSYDEAGFRFALNQDAMATEKRAEGIRAFCL